MPYNANNIFLFILFWYKTDEKEKLESNKNKIVIYIEINFPMY